VLGVEVAVQRHASLLGDNAHIRFAQSIGAAAPISWHGVDLYCAALPPGVVVCQVT
jgi:hypothetical protein